ncbi:chorismate--pyruvate lyase family protein [Alteromonas sediminis]|uniref:chorismate--pyruvate lyase family protein n=1 Tax=Alteromonas sediminis TaxID=2259342 RepID=UPI001F0BDAC6|nr:chorismate lyase [Alteromonas sediminis]
MQHAPSFPVGLTVTWKPESHALVPNNYLRNWLLDTGSLTERIQSHCRQFSVYRIGQGVAPLSTEETQRLNDIDSAYEIREVLLLADDTPWVFARSVVPVSLSTGEWRDLGSQPLGKLLFNDTRFTRGEFEVAEVPFSVLSSLPITPVSHPLYGRRSLFTLEEKQILVAEVFLPASPVYQSVVS